MCLIVSLTLFYTTVLSRLLFYFKFTLVFSLNGWFDLIKKINTLSKEINRLVSKEMLNIYLKLTTKKTWRTQNFEFLLSKSLSTSHFWGAPTHADIIEFSNFLLQLNNQRSGSKNLCGFPIIFILEGIMTLKIKEPMLFVQQKFKL